MGATPRTPARAEHVGSLLRPERLRREIEAFYGAGHRAVQAEERAKDRERLRAVEDDAIADVVRRQVDAGLDVATDGEFRRYMFLNSFWDAVEGFSTEDNPVEFTDGDGSTVVWHAQKITDRLRIVDSPASREAGYLADHPFKITFPAASIFAIPYTYKPSVCGHAYGSLEELVDHAVEIERRLVADAVEAGARYVQFDFPLYPYLADPRWSGAMGAAGFDTDRVLAHAIEVDNAVLEGIPDDVTVALHVCRGNYRSHYLCEGALDGIAERMFGELAYDVFLVEWEDPGRMGDFGPLRFVPAGKTVVMGVISSKSPEVEDEEDVLRRMDEAAGYLDVEQLAVSPQCGFASVMEGNETNEEAQWRKLDVVVRVADRIWG